MNFIPNPHPHRAQGRQSQHHAYKILISYRPTAGNEFNALLIDDCSESAFRTVLTDDESVVYSSWNNALDYSRYPRGNTAPTVLPQMHYRYRGSTVQYTRYRPRGITVKFYLSPR